LRGTSSFFLFFFFWLTKLRVKEEKEKKVEHKKDISSSSLSFLILNNRGRKIPSIGAKRVKKHRGEKKKMKKQKQK